MKDELRFSIKGDEPELKALRKAVFEEDDAQIDGFFEHLYAPGSAVAYLHEGHIVSAAYVVYWGEFVSEGQRRQVWAVCGLGTHPDHRSRGCGGRVLRMATEAASRKGVAVIVPVEPSLFSFCKRVGYTELFNGRGLSGRDTDAPLYGSVTRVSLRGYAALREELLRGREHIDLDLNALRYQESLCDASGGGLFYVVSSGVRCCAAVEKHGGAARIRELIVPSGSPEPPALLACRTLKCREFTCLSPVRPGEEATPFAMIAGKAPDHDTGLAWFGFAPG